MLLTFFGIIVTTTAIGIAVGRRAHRAAPHVTLETAHHECRGLVVACVLGFMLLGAPLLAQVSDRFCQRLPVRVQRDAATLTWMLLVGLFPLIAGAVSTIAVLTGHPKRRRLLFAIGLVVVLLGAASWLQTRPIHARLFIRKSPDGAVLQSSSSSCAAATIANIVERFGMSITEADAADLMGTTSLGSSPGQMRYALAELGIEYRTLNERTRSLTEVASPAILFVDHSSVGREGHAVAFFGVSDDGVAFSIIDPLQGRQRWSPEAFARIWHGNGIECLARNLER